MFCVTTEGLQINQLINSSSISSLKFIAFPMVNTGRELSSSMSIHKEFSGSILGVA
jgi:hypothetical protein